MADVPGEEGMARRREAYADYFLRMGRDVRIDAGCRFSHPDRIVLDDDVRINVGALIYGSGGVHVGRHARVGPRFFLHSANHDVSADDERAYFERGYEYEAVTIGDNCLISANVSVLPGAHIGNGVFVGCGAVVTKGEYADGCRIMGVPGRAATPELPAAPKPAPSIAIVTHREPAYADAAKLLIEALGLPQVRVFSEGEPLPPSVHAALAFGPPQWKPQCGVALWRLEEGEVTLRGDLTAHERPVRLPGRRLHTLAPAADRRKRPLENAATLSHYYAVKRARKRGNGLEGAERLETLIAICVLRAGGRPDADAVAQELLELLLADRGQVSTAEQRLRTVLSERSFAREAHRALAEVVWELGAMTDSMRGIARTGGGQQLSAAAFLACPEAAVALMSSAETTAIAARVSEAVNQCTKAAQLASFGAAAALAHNQAVFDQVEERLLSSDFFDERHQCVRSTIGAAASSYSPVVAAILLKAIWRQQPDYRPRGLVEQEEPLIWSVFAGGDRGWMLTSEAGSATGSLIDSGRRLISRSLLDNWLIAQRVPVVEEGAQYELSRHNYEPLVSALDGVWGALFRWMQHGAGRPLIRLRPWPHGCKAALSLRYDIDRPTFTDQIRTVIDAQVRLFNSACASWYALPGTEHGDRVSKTASLFVQETGVHALCGADAREGRGVTCHSAPTSEYWRGSASVIEWERRGAAYGEMLAAQLGWPRRAWYGGLPDGRATAMSLLPIHFPLEGTTADTTLEYFDRLADQFRQLIDLGGHAIIGSHPDLNQSLLFELAKREDLDFDQLWCASVARIVDRCRKVLGYGNIDVVMDGQAIALTSRHTLADVHMEIDHPDGSTTSMSTQLNAGVARKIH